MKRLVPCLLFFSLLSSCEQPEYYDAGYYHSVPPRSEIYGFDEQPHDYRHSRHRHPKVSSNQGNVHGHKAKNVHAHDNERSRVTKHASESRAHVITHNN